MRPYAKVQVKFVLRNILVGIALLGWLLVLSQSPRLTGTQLSAERLEAQIRAQLPAGALLREFRPIPSTSKTLVIYIEHSVVESDEGLEASIWTCSGQVNGQGIEGVYHLALWDGTRFASDVILPPAWKETPSGVQTIVYRQYKQVLHRLWGGAAPLDKNDALKLVEVRLMQLKDLNGDGLAHEFQLVVYVAGCGHVQVLTAGYSVKQQKAIVYPVFEESDEPSFWSDNFYPDETGVVRWKLPCGDHANDVDTEKTFGFDPAREAYVLRAHSETICAGAPSRGY